MSEASVTPAATNLSLLDSPAQGHCVDVLKTAAPALQCLAGCCWLVRGWCTTSGGCCGMDGPTERHSRAAVFATTAGKGWKPYLTCEAAPSCQAFRSTFGSSHRLLASCRGIRHSHLPSRGGGLG